ncbi:MAG TPA: hypothetical protein VE779_18005 [Candidatus Angelobacter sp.]|nr:hypothetical protein [Candidatus Angelobacter sp.]
MQCSNCGYENPREHRYCGMCGTPFPYRAVTAPEAQTALAFESAPVVAPAPLHPPVAEPVASVERAGKELEAAAPEAAAIATEEPAIERREVWEPKPVEEMGAASAVSLADELAAPVPAVPVQAPVEVETPLSVQPVAELEEVPEPAAAEIVPATPEMPRAAEVVPEAPAEPSIVEAARTAAPKEIEAAAHPPAPRVIVMPVPRPHLVAPAASTAAPAKPTVIHPSPDTLAFSPPPVSAGMPTFREVQEAAGPPAISPFEPPAETHTDEDRELQEYVASFRYSPPVETADELTMRSEVPVIDEEAPAEFHHPSFDDDVPPPLEAGPHPTGEEYYPPSHATERPHFLEIPDKQPAGAAETFPGVLGGDGEAAPRSKKRWLWASIAAVVTIFGGLGYLEGRAQSTHAFRGPVELARNAYALLRAQMAQPVSSPPPVADNGAIDKAKQVAAQPKPEAANTSTDAAAPTSPPTEKPTEATQTPTGQAASESKAAADTAAPVETAKSEPAKPIQQPPAPKPSAKPQPGQQELDKALNASDPTAAAAWLWKATSRGNPEAPVRLADLYIKGNGVPKSCEQAMVLLRSAATKENAPARNRLAALYANGTCVARDRVKAYQLMSSALTADPSSEWAKENRETLWSQMTPEERAVAQKYR